LGIPVVGAAPQDMEVTGQAGPLVTDGRSAELFVGLAGTAIRPLAAALNLGNGEFTLDGTARMRERPIHHLVDALRLLGANIHYQGADGYPPIAIQANGLRGGTTQIDGSISSQFLSSLLLAAPYSSEAVTIDIIGELVSQPYVDITLNLMQRFGITVDNQNYQRFVVPHGIYQSPGDFLVEGDASSASYFLAAGAISGPGMRIHGLGADSIQGDIAFVDVLRDMGAQVHIAAQHIEVKPGQLHGIDADLNHIPDAAMTVAVLALFAKGDTHIRNIYNWRVKETDRLSAMATELRKLGAEVVETDDSISITPPAKLQSAQIGTYGDHRMAMCFSLASLAGVQIALEDPACVGKTFPTYFQEFARLAS
jgi:3-phosphoshikimate 1-carboxyvinyltransferase